MAKHKHAELMMQYAQDAMETDKPWERWQVWSLPTSEWVNCKSPPDWYVRTEYRRKPRTININGFEVPEPVRDPLKRGDGYYTPFLRAFILDEDLKHRWHRWDDDEFDRDVLELGLVHLTKEAAELHAKALLSFTAKRDE